MSTLLVTHHDCIEHDPGEFHPEHPDRLRGILRLLEAEDFMLLHRDEAPHATHAQLLRVHPLSYIEDILAKVPHDGHHSIDGDTYMSPYTGEAALRSAGGACAAVDAVARGEVRNAFVAGRPPGHHAERSQAMGFCFFNNVAVAAYHAREVHGLQRVAVMDFDVHHGNGTQHIFWDDPDAMYCSTHQEGTFPYTGLREETGAHNNIVNCPLPAGAKGDLFREAMENDVLPALRAFKPDILFISAGFDAHARDPMAHLRFNVADFVWATDELLKVAEECCQGRLVSVLEGGYDVVALSASVAAHVRRLMGI
ncbi:histone deacetylase family protein [Insolitispirillum peregrinum]|uniref:Acetoin utilization deacetylase AcuC n=1 Tax=Insolitispirillum peregrinum TaxID=80876 RepID=A0A1N7LYG2_9PROT|nr:histone deacetylase family protein [Insolitispirillum peregrinum]SIS78857.1 Acetoin utilization deacetylase AcuC [Insolitispirillum peregrinum]